MEWSGGGRRVSRPTERSPPLPQPLPPPPEICVQLAPGDELDTKPVVLIPAGETRLKLNKSLRFEKPSPPNPVRSAGSHSPSLNAELAYQQSLSPQQLQLSSCGSCSGGKPNIMILKRRYSMFRKESMIENEYKVLKDGPSSQTTVLSLVGLFVCGLTLIAAAGIVLWRQQEPPFVMVGAGMLGVGLAMLLMMCFLQRKNIAKYYGDVCDDLGFLRQSATVAPIYEIYVRY